MDELHLLTAVDLAAAYHKRRLSPVEVARAALERVTLTAPTINAFALVDETSALRSALESERRWQAGNAIGPLDGVPVAPKDNMLVAGWPTRIGSVTSSPELEREDSPYVKRLRDAGAVFIGKTATPEYCWTGWTQSIVNGITRNPWDLSRTVGGSSGGAGAAIAGGLAAVALGTDAGGSIRTPAGLTGSVGFKPSINRVPMHVSEGYSNLNSVGPITASVADARGVFALMAGEPERPIFAYSDKRPLAGVKIAFTPTMGYARYVSPDIEAGLREAAAILAELGADVSESAPQIDWPIDIYNTIGWAEQANNLGSVVESHAGEMDSGLVEIVGVGKRISAGEYIAAQKQRWLISKELRVFHGEYDLLLTPTLPITAFAANKIGPNSDAVTSMNDWLPFSSIFNMTGQPALSLPFGFDATGLPFGVQFVGRVNEDWMVLDAASHLEVTAGWVDEIRRRRARLP